MSQGLDDLLLIWESNYKRGLLTFWMLLVLHERPAYTLELGKLIDQASAGSLSADDNSLYRALNRFERLDLVQAETRPSNVGPDRRYYRLTTKGVGLLRRFTERNIQIFDRPEVQQSLRALFAPPASAEEA